MIEYYNHFIHPASPARSKLAIHLNAQASAETQAKTSVTAAVEKGLEVLGLQAEEEDKPASDQPATEESNRTAPYVITDVRDFRSKMQVSAGPQPVKHISEFEELDSKL